MSYIRPLEDNMGLYIYPDDIGIRFTSYPNHCGEVIPDDMFDVALALISDEELLRRIKHGKILLKALKEDDIDTWKEYRSFWKEGSEW